MGNEPVFSTWLSLAMQSWSDITSLAYCTNRVNISFYTQTLVFLDEGILLSHPLSPASDRQGARLASQTTAQEWCHEKLGVKGQVQCHDWTRGRTRRAARSAMFCAFAALTRKTSTSRKHSHCVQMHNPLINLNGKRGQSEQYHKCKLC